MTSGGNVLLKVLFHVTLATSSTQISIIRQNLQPEEENTILMDVFSCLSWVQFLCDQIYSRFSLNNSVDREDRELPDDIIVEILTRIPAKCLFLPGHACTPLGALTKTPYFVDKHFSQATPVIAFQYWLIRWKNDNYLRDVTINFIDEVTKKISRKSIEIDLTVACPRNRDITELYGSYNGFLLLKNKSSESVLFIWNPITQERVSVIARDSDYHVHGIFFHPIAKEYKVIFVALDGKLFKFTILSLKTKTSRLIARFTYPPSSVSQPVIVNGVLHWMVSDDSYKDVHRSFPQCENTIVAFNTISEELYTMGHPDASNCLFSMSIRHDTMKLTEAEGHLCLLDNIRCGKIIIWMLEDHEKKVWVRIYDIYLKPSKNFCYWPGRCETHMIVEALYMYKGELLLRVGHSGLFSYNLELRTLRRVEDNSKYEDFRRVKKTCEGSRVAAVVHVNSLLSLDTTDDTVFLSKHD